MSRFVLDASVALGWFIDHPVPALASRIRASLVQGAKAMVPSVWHLEVANGLLVAERRGTLDAHLVDLYVTEIEGLLASVIESDSGMPTVRQAAQTGRMFRLASYDAVYLDLARQEGIPLGTLDQKLRIAAIRAGVEVVR